MECFLEDVCIVAWGCVFLLVVCGGEYVRAAGLVLVVVVVEAVGLGHTRILNLNRVVIPFFFLSLYIKCGFEFGCVAQVLAPSSEN